MRGASRSRRRVRRRIGVPPAGEASPSAPVSATWTPLPDPTLPPHAVRPQPQLPLPTYVRLGVDDGAADPLLILFTDGMAAFTITDAAGLEVARVPLPGSGRFDGASCVSSGRNDAAPRPEIILWRGLDRAVLEDLVRRPSAYRAVAHGIPAGEVTLSLVDGGCRGRSGGSR